MGCSCNPSYLGSMDFKIEKSSDHKGLCENYFCLKLAYNPCLEVISAFKAGHHSVPVFGFKEQLRASPDGEVIGTSMMYVLPPGEYLVAYARYITPLCEEAIACSLQIYISKHGSDAAKSLRLDSVVDLALLDIYPVEAIIRKFRVLDADHAEVTDTWTCHGNECEEILYAINRMRGIV